MSSMRIVSVFSVVLCLWVSRAWAQMPEVDAGSRIRVSVDSPARRLTGITVALTVDSLLFISAYRADTIAVARHAIRRLEVSRGRRSVGGGALLGGIEGMTLGGAAMLVAGIANGCLNLNWDYSARHCPTNEAALGVVIGVGAVGAIIGSVVRGERWARVPFARVHVSHTPTGVSIAIGL